MSFAVVIPLGAALDERGLCMSRLIFSGHALDRRWAGILEGREGVVEVTERTTGREENCAFPNYRLVRRDRWVPRCHETTGALRLVGGRGCSETLSSGWALGLQINARHGFRLGKRCRPWSGGGVVSISKHGSKGKTRLPLGIKQGRPGDIRRCHTYHDQSE